MGFLKSIEEQKEIIKKELETFLIKDENIEIVFILTVDFVCLTNKRLIFVDKTILSKKSAIITIPYNKITSIAIQKGGAFSITDIIEINVSSESHDLKLYKGEDVINLYNSLADKIC